MGAYAQSATLSGRITSKGKAVEFATVALIKTKFGTLSDTTGAFRLNNIPAGAYQLSVSLVGFETLRRSITLSAGQKLTLDLELKELLTNLGEVVVTGTMKEVSKLDSPVPVEVYTPIFFKRNPAPSVFDALQNINGVRPQLNCNVCNTGDIHINGLEGPYTMVLIDGMPIVSGLSTVYGLSGIPSSLIQRVEVVKGPASMLYGSEAIAGLINVITKSPEKAPAVAADVFSTSWGEVNADVGVRMKAGKVNSLLGVNVFYFNNPIDNNSDGFTDLTLQKRFSVFDKISFSRASNRVATLGFRYVYEDRWGGQTNWTKQERGGDQIYGESIYTNRLEMIGTYQLPVRERLMFSYSINSHKQDSYYGNTPYMADQKIAFGQLTLNKTYGRHGLLFGTALRYTYYDDSTPATATPDGLRNEPSKILLPGFFVQDEFDLADNTKLLFGGRYDRSSVHGNIFIPRVNVKWSPDPLNTLRLTAGNGFRVVNLFTEDHAALTGARSVVITEALKPEKSWNANFNYQKLLKISDGILTLDGTLFYTYFSNRIIPDYLTDPNKIIYSNLSGYGVSRGFSLNFDYSTSAALKFNGGITLMDVFQMNDENGTLVKARPVLTERFNGVWAVTYTFKKANLSIDYTGNVYGPMILPTLGPLDPRPSQSPWWSLQNIQLTKKFGEQWELYGGVKNLLNYLPPANAIARPFDPFDKQVKFDASGQVIPTADNPYALTFDPNYVYAPNQGIRGFLGVRYTLNR